MKLSRSILAARRSSPRCPRRPRTPKSRSTSSAAPKSPSKAWSRPTATGSTTTSPTSTATPPDGSDTDYELRRAELVLKGKGPGNVEWVLGYDAKADKFLDVNVKYKFGGNANHFVQVGQYKQPNSLEELSLDQEQRLHLQGDDHQHLRASRAASASPYSYGDDNWAHHRQRTSRRELTRNLARRGSGYGVRGYLGADQRRPAASCTSACPTWTTMPTPHRRDTAMRAARARPDADLAGARLVDTGNLHRRRPHQRPSALEASGCTARSSCRAST